MLCMCSNYFSLFTKQILVSFPRQKLLKKFSKFGDNIAQCSKNWKDWTGCMQVNFYYFFCFPLPCTWIKRIKSVFSPNGPFFGYFYFISWFSSKFFSYRRKSALPKYDLPYKNRPIVLPGAGPGGGGSKGFGHPHSPHPNHPAQQHFGGGGGGGGLPHDGQGGGNGPGGVGPGGGGPGNMEETNKMINFTPTPTYRSME